ncbi:DUF4249 domain-containing protein [Algoriphagus zhangzhouensis]|nr:DUF4249 domain-containing protein [Algoriphagus zhangzhouensis]
MSKKVIGIACFLIISLLGCREEFEPKISGSDSRILVVEGYLDTDGVSSLLSLSYTQSLQSDIQDFPKVLGATVYLEASSGERFYLSEAGGGDYRFEQDISEEDTFVLKIFLPEGESYSSRELKPLNSTDIIEVDYEKNEDGVEIFITTQGDENTDDFLWTYEETWAFKPPFPSNFKYDQELKDVVERTESEKYDLCYRSEANSALILQSSSNFEDQLVFRQPILQINHGDERLSERYSILITQKALAPDATEFWENLRENTDDLGTIFSPLPSQIQGNMVHDQNPEIPVIGQVGLGKVSQKRLFIDILEVYPWQPEVDDYFGCSLGADTVFVINYEAEFRFGNKVPTYPIYTVNGLVPIGYLYSEERCVDCTLRGSNVAPEFWED